MDFCDPFRFLWSLFSVFLCGICEKVQCLEGFSFELMHWYGCVSDLNKCSDIKNENKYLFFDWLESLIYFCVSRTKIEKRISCLKRKFHSPQR